MGAGEDVRARVDLALADHVEYDVLRSNDMKDISNLLEDLIKLGAHEQMFFCALKSGLWYKGPAFEKK